jgi:penicillin amidase
MFADSTGQIAWTAPANLPYRDKQAFTWDPASYTGTLPCFVLDGASGNHEWTGSYLEDDFIPHLTHPAKGWIATANTDNVASTIDNDPSNDVLPNGQPFYIGCEFAQGFRLGRIHERIEAALGTMTLEEMASIQADHKSALGSRLAQFLIASLEKAEAEKATPGTHPDLSALVTGARYTAADIPDLIASLKKWQSDGFLAASGVNPDTGALDVPAAEADAAKATALFNAWVVRAIARVFEDEFEKIGETDAGTTFTSRGFIRLLEADPTTLATYDATTQDSALWDDLGTATTVESRDERLVTAMLDGLDDLGALIGSDRTKWRWGNLHTVRFDSLISVWLLSIPPVGDPVFPKGFPRHGDQWNVDASNFGIIKRLKDPLNFSYGSGPVQRFVAEVTSAGPIIRNALPGGAVMNPESPHFRDEAEYWRKNENHEVAFAIDDVVAAFPSGGEHILFTP